ncbi:hypothetical protein OAM67_00470 [bacterium]|nr:hypothetical protein [bacterium]
MSTQTAVTIVKHMLDMHVKMRSMGCDVEMIKSSITLLYKFLDTPCGRCLLNSPKFAGVVNDKITAFRKIMPELVEYRQKWNL